MLMKMRLENWRKAFFVGDEVKRRWWVYDLIKEMNKLNLLSLDTNLM